jgi:hypothetical protein
VRITSILLLVLLLLSCRKEAFTSDPSARLQGPADTLRFDTVFASAGSVTRTVKLFNHNREGLRIASVRLAGGDASPFRINADGQPGPEIRDLEVAAGDSTYLFITVRINPSSNRLPFVVRDSIEISYNGNLQKIRLEAYGQNARFLRGHIVDETETWDNSLPYVILDGLLVAEGATLEVPAGTQVYFHADAPLLVEGTLQVKGGADSADRVVFRSDRLDAPYRDFPAGWPGIVFRASSSNNLIRYARILNAYQAVALQEPAPGSGPKLRLEQTEIDNAYDAGILAVHSSLEAENLLVSNCGKNVQLVQGGTYSFTHCTLAAYANTFLQHKDPVLFVSNYLNVNNVLESRALDAVFRNCIIWGEGGLTEDEAVVTRSGATPFHVRFDGVLWNVKNTPAEAVVTRALAHEDPQFETIDNSRRLYNFRLGPSSPALAQGVAAGTALDLDARPRPATAPDLGAYERP